MSEALRDVSGLGWCWWLSLQQGPKEGPGGGGGEEPRRTGELARAGDAGEARQPNRFLLVGPDSPGSAGPVPSAPPLSCPCDLRGFHLGPPGVSAGGR